MNKKNLQSLITTNEVEKLMLNIRGKNVLLDRDVATLYGVETKRINEAVRNNPEKFPFGYIFELDKYEVQQIIGMRKNFAVENFDRKTEKAEKQAIIDPKSRYTPKAFTEKGLYMLATILKSPQAVSTTLAIIDTFTMTRQLARTMESLQTVEDGGEQQKGLLQKTGEILADIVGNNLSTATSETEIELNFAVVKIKHKVIKKKDE